MSTVIEITSQRIRFLRLQEARLVSLEDYPVGEGLDPIDALGAAPLPRPLGKVRVAVNHKDLLLQAMVQPSAPTERLDRIIRFEIQTLIGDLDQVLTSWMPAPTAGTGDLRILIMIARRSLVQRLRDGLAKHGGSLEALVHPGIGLVQAWQDQARAGTDEETVLVDVGGAAMHVALMRAGELIFLRSHGAGANELVDNIAQLRGLEPEEAAKIVRRMGASPPQDIRDLVQRQAQVILTSLTAVFRFAQSQLRTDPFKPGHLVVAGAGAQVPGLVEVLRERFDGTVHVLNPFAGLVSQLPAEALDDCSQLPSPWAVALGCGRPKRLPLDVMEQVRAERRSYWQSSGALRVVAVVVVVLALAGLARQYLARNAGSHLNERLLASGEGLLPRARAAEEALNGIRNQQRSLASEARFLVDESWGARLAVEMLNAVSRATDPTTRRVVLTSFRLDRVDQPRGGARVLLQGTAEASQGRGSDEVVHDFSHQLARQFEPVVSIQEGPPRFEDGRLVFELTVLLDPYRRSNQPAVAAPSGRAATEPGDAEDRRPPPRREAERRDSRR